MRPIREISSSDLFFFYDTIGIEQSNEAELVTAVMQPKKSMFYNRRFGAGVSESTNYPNTIAMIVGIPYDIIDSIAIRNTQVVDGTRKQKDRRLASSQGAISLSQDKDGGIEVRLSYINFFNYEEQNTNITLPIGSLK